MTVAYQRTAAEHSPVRKTSESASVAELVGVILDKGIVVDAWASVPVLGLELLTIEARVVVASIATYLRYAEAIGLTAHAALRPRHLPPGEEVLGYLSAHPDEFQPGEPQVHRSTARPQAGQGVNHVVEEGRVRPALAQGARPARRGRRVGRPESASVGRGGGRARGPGAAGGGPTRHR
jgi:hypothetical protein